MGRARKVDVEKIKELYSKGYSDYRIARELDVTPWTVGYYRRKLGLPALYERRRPRRIDFEKFKQLYAQGYTYKQIAEQLGTTIGTVCAYVTKYKLANRQPRRIKITEDGILRLVEQKGYVTVDDVAKNFKVHIFTARERLHRLEQKGLLKRFKVGRSYTGSQRYSGVDFFRALNVRGNEILYYSDEKRFIELLSKVVEVDLNDRGAKRSLTALFRDNNLPDELIDLFYKLKSSFSTSTPSTTEQVAR
jgi:DNA-binding CsgD family transcriptional regulator/DNA-binding Lrp family transcriptional regulator